MNTYRVITDDLIECTDEFGTSQFIPTDRANADYRQYLIDVGQWSEPGANIVAE